MKLSHWKLGTVLLGVLILLCLVWWPEGEAPDSLQPVITTNDAAVSPVPELNPPSTRRHFHPEKCAACPDMDLEAMKRVPGGDRSDCQEFLMDAAESGNPDPDTSQLEDCTGWSPLHFAETPEQVQALLEAGVDPNVQDLEGRTPLYLHAQKAMMMPSENGQSISRSSWRRVQTPYCERMRAETPLTLLVSAIPVAPV